jgi:NADH-quinone oxidoreductase subunit N
MPPVTSQSIVESLIRDTLESSLPNFRPELILCATIVVLLVARVFPLVNRIPSLLIAAAGGIAALVAALPAEGLASWTQIGRQELFTGMLVYDGLTAFMRLFLVAFALLLIVLARLTGLADREEGQDFYCLVFGATVGMCLMASANHMLTLFLGVEMASVPSYVLAGIIKGRQRSSEAALKYAVYGAGTAGVMLYGISLLAGVLGSVHLPTMAQRLAELDIAGKFAAGEQTDVLMVLALGGLMLGVGLAFKLSAVPFHFWCPDVFEGASAEINGFLSVASKAAALALLIRVGLGLGYLPEQQTAVAATAAATVPVRLVSTSLPTAVAAEVGAEESSAAAESDGPLGPVRVFFVTLLGVAAMITCTFGNLAAYGQTNIKRMFAYSTIAHAGYMMMPVAAAVALVGRSPDLAATAIGSLLVYASFYLFMNLGAFAIIAFLRNSMQSEEIQDYAGLIRTCPLVAVCMTAILFSLVGLPPLAGFVGKFRVFQSLVEAGGPLMITMLVVAGVNTAISLVYYLRLAKTICIDEAPDTSRPAEMGFLGSCYVTAVSLPVLVFGILPNSVARAAQEATAGLFG